MGFLMILLLLSIVLIIVTTSVFKLHPFTPLYGKSLL